MNLFELATRKKYRFESSKGLLSVEQLYELPLTAINGPSLNSVGKTIYSMLQNNEDTNFVDTVNTAVQQMNKVLNNKLEIVKEIIAYKQEQLVRQKKRIATLERNQQIMEIMDDKKNESMSKKSMKQLQAMLSEGIEELDEED